MAARIQGPDEMASAHPAIPSFSIAASQKYSAIVRDGSPLAIGVIYLTVTSAVFRCIEELGRIETAGSRPQKLYLRQPYFLRCG